ncbi:MAG: hypothetical protein LBC84_02000 [Prevotellaceae bacterium]|jgi:hypothetical protein|nr:hypothetical protein [Prevotellaceae bacterium]
MKIKFHFLLLAISALPLSCATPGLGTYTLRLASVRQDPPPSQEVLAQIVTKQEDGKTIFHFQDENIKVEWDLANTRFHFTLTNVSEHFIKIPWDEAVYVDQYGKARRVIHDGIPYERKGEPQPFTVVPQGARIDDFLLPVDNILAENKNFVNWKVVYLFYDKLKNVGQEVKLVLPMMLQNVRFDYVFTFKVEEWKDDVKTRSTFLWGREGV